MFQDEYLCEIKIGRLESLHNLYVLSVMTCALVEQESVRRTDPLPHERDGFSVPPRAHSCIQLYDASNVIEVGPHMLGYVIKLKSQFVNIENDVKLAIIVLIQRLAEARSYMVVALHELVRGFTLQSSEVNKWSQTFIGSTLGTDP